MAQKTQQNYGDIMDNGGRLTNPWGEKYGLA